MSTFIDPNATYRVCQDSVTTGQTQCASLDGTPLTTSCSGQGAGGSTGGGSKPCRGTMCT